MTRRAQRLDFVRSETDLFTEPGYDLAVTGTSTNKYFPVATLTQTAPIEFFIQGNDQQYLDLSKTKLKVRFKVVGTDGASNIGAQADLAVLNYAPVNYLIASAFDRVTVHLNETEVTPKGSLYPYQAYLETLLSYGSEYKKGQAEAGGFYRTKKEDAANIVNDDGWKSRYTLCKESKEFELIGRPHGEIFSQPRYLMPGVDIRITFNRSSSGFCLEKHGSDAATSPKLLIMDAVLYVQKVSLLPSLHLNQLKEWQQRPCVYPGKRVVMKSYSLPSGTLHHTNENLLNGLIPDRLIIGLVRTDYVQGTIGSNPFNFDVHDLEQIVVTCNGETTTQHVINIDKTNNKTLEGFISLFDAMGIAHCDMGLDIRLQEWLDGKALYGFDLKNLTDGFAMPRHGNCSIYLKFKTALPNAVSVIIYPEYPSTMYIDNRKQITFKDYAREY